jgi:hypothetical protein
MNQHLILRLSPPHGHEQSLQYDVAGLVSGHQQDMVPRPSTIQVPEMDHELSEYEAAAIILARSEEALS